MGLELDFATPTGTLLTVQFIEKEGSMSERIGEGGAEGRRVLFVRWNDRRLAMLELRGRTYPDPSNPNNWLFVYPLTFPGNSALQCKIVEVKGIAKIVDATNETINYQYAELTVTYRPSKMPNVNNQPPTTIAQVIATLSFSATAEFIEIPDGRYFWASGAVDRVSSAKPGKRVNLIEHTYEELSRPVLPQPEIRAAIGKINDADWEGVPKETLLFLGVDARKTISTDTTQPYNITWKFLERPKAPWNFVFDPDRVGVASGFPPDPLYPDGVDDGWFRIYAQDASGPNDPALIYETVDFGTLF